MSKTAAKPHLSEAEEQCKLMAWAEYCVWAGVYPELALLFAIPNGGKRNAAEAAHLKRQGVKAGVPDLCLAVPRGAYHGLYIELKVGTNKPTENQLAYGYAVAVCYSAEEAKDVIDKYLNQKEGEKKIWF